MEIKDKVLELLQSSSEAVSGEGMAQTLGVTRSSVWKAIRRLRESGYEIEAATNRGYLLRSESDAMTAETVKRQLGEAASRLAIDVRDSVSSTNTVLKEIAEKGGLEGMVVLSEQQSAGKGRLGRSFCSPRGTGLYLSILLRPKFPAEQSLFITTAAAVAVAQAVEALTGERALIKWVNDVYLRGKKICGILTEASLDFEGGGLHYAVLGIGVNIQEPPGGFSKDLQDIVGVLFPQGCPKGVRAKLAGEILRRFLGFYDCLEKKAFMQEYRQRSLLTGMEITFSLGQEQYEGKVEGIDDQARLMVRLPDGRTRLFSAGEVNIKKDYLQQLRREEKS